MSDPTPQELALREHTQQLESRIEQMQLELDRLRAADTRPPPPPSSLPPDADTGDYSNDAKEARLSMLEMGVATRDSELTEIHRQLKDIHDGLTNLALAVAALPCNPKCPECPNDEHRHLHSIPAE